MKQIRVFNTVNEMNAAYLANPNIDMVSYVSGDGSVHRRKAGDSLGEMSFQMTADPDSDVVLYDTVNIQFTLTNTGPVALENILYECQTTGDSWGQEILYPTETQNFGTSISVDDDFILQGKIPVDFTVTANTATGQSYSKTWTSYITTEEINSHCTCNVSASLSTFHNAGEDIVLSLQMTNDGNLRLNNSTISLYKSNDKSALLNRMVGSGQNGVLDGGETSKTITYTYTTTEADVSAGEIIFYVSANAECSDPYKPYVTGDTLGIVITRE